MQFIQGNNRHQTYFNTLEDQVGADNPVRLIDAFIDKLELQKIVLPKTRFAWKLTSCNFEFKSEHAGENINIIFNHLDDLIKNPPSLLEYIRNKKSWGR